MLLNFWNCHVKQMTISVGTEYTTLNVVLLICQKRTVTWIYLFDPRLSRLNNASHILKRKHFVCGSGSQHFLSKKGWRFDGWYHHTSLIRVNTSSVSFFWKVYHLIGLQTCWDERLDLLETLQEHREQLLNVLVPVILPTEIREEDLQTILPCVRELGCCGTIHHASRRWRGWSCWGLTPTTKKRLF